MRSLPVDRASHDKRIRDSVGAWLRTEPDLVKIACYHPLRDEPDLRPLLDEFSDRLWYFPKVTENGTMSFHRVKSLHNDLVPGAFGIQEPSGELPLAAPLGIDLFLCPGMAFAPASMTRLGRGKGYYDRYLSEAQNSAVFAGVSFPEHLVDQTYAEKHDIRMHRIFS